MDMNMDRFVGHDGSADVCSLLLPTSPPHIVQCIVESTVNSTWAAQPGQPWGGWPFSSSWSEQVANNARRCGVRPKYLRQRRRMWVFVVPTVALDLSTVHTSDKYMHTYLALWSALESSPKAT